jgi:hypothetical protein
MKIKFDIKNNLYRISLIAVWGGVFFVLVICYFTFHLPKKEMLTQVQRQYTESNDQLLIANKAKRQDVREEMEQRFEKIQQTVRHFSVPQDNMTGLVFEIGKIANELGLSQFSSKNDNSHDIPTIGESSEIKEAWLQVEFNASFLKFAQFVNRLERQAPTVFVEQVTLRRNINNRAENEIIMDLSFLVTQNKSNSVAVADASID